jgi:ubiquinone/menaquinone biosynthesis C-methylase UbiE
VTPSSLADRLERQFDATAARYDRMVSLNPGYHDHLRAAARRLLAELPAGNGGSVLRLVDLGCGSGASTAALVRALDGRVADILGLDASAGMLAAARKKSWPPGVRFRHARAEEAALAEPGSPLDGVLACYLLRNVADRDRLLRDVLAALRPDGVLVLQDYSVAGSRRAAALWTFVCWAVVIPLSLVLTRSAALYRYLWRSVLTFDSVEELAARLRAAGFVDVSVGTVAGWQRGILHTVVARRPR